MAPANNSAEEIAKAGPTSNAIAFGFFIPRFSIRT